jgi:hypothetical protein
MAFRTLNTDVVQEGDNLSSFTAEEDVAQGQVVKLGANGYSVEPSDTDGERVIGVATYDATDGETVAVAMSGCEVLATSGTGSVTAGDPVASHGATGEEGEVATAASGDYVLGDALQDDAGDGDDVYVKLDLGGQVN